MATLSETLNPKANSKIIVEPCIFIILGATGDLTHRKLLPALLRLMAQGLVPDNFAILGVARSAELDDDGFRARGRGGFREREAEECHVRSDGPPERRRGLARAEPTLRGRARRLDGRDHGVGKSPEQFATLIKKDIEVWRGVVKKAGVKAE